MIKAIIFDYDGVIADTFGAVFEVYKKICRHFEVPAPKDIDQFRKIYGYNYLECCYNLGIKEKDIVELNDIYRKEIIDMDSKAFPGIVEVIKKLKEKYKLYLVSASHSHEVLSKLKKFGLIDYFEEIKCGADANIRKSRLVIDLLDKNNYSPDELFSVGDREVDYHVGQQAGLPDENIILVTYGWGFDKDKVGRAKIVDRPEEILEFVG